MGQQQSRLDADEPLKVTKLRAELRHIKERNKMLSDERKLMTKALEADLYEKRVQLYKLGKTATKHIGFRGYLKIIKKVSPVSPLQETVFTTTYPDYNKFNKSDTTKSTAMVLRNAIMNFTFSSLFEAWLLKRTHFVQTQNNQRRLHQKGWKSIVAFYSEEIPVIQEAFLKQETELRRRVESGKEHNMAMNEAYTNHIATQERVELEMRQVDSSANLSRNDSSFESESRDPKKKLRRQNSKLRIVKQRSVPVLELSDKDKKDSDWAESESRGPKKLRRQNSKLRMVKERSVPVLELSDKDDEDSDWAESTPSATRKTSSPRKKRGGSETVSMTGQGVDADADESDDSTESNEEEQTSQQQSIRLPSHRRKKEGRARMVTMTGNVADVGEEEDTDGDSDWSEELGDGDNQHKTLPTGTTIPSESEATCLSSISAVSESITDDDSDWGPSPQNVTRKKSPTKNEDTNEDVVSVDEVQSSDDDVEILDTEEKKDGDDAHLQTDAMEQIAGQGSMEYTRRELEHLERGKQERLEKSRQAREEREKFYGEERERLGRQDQQLRSERTRRASLVGGIRQEDHEQMVQPDHRNQDDHYEDMAPDRVEVEDEEEYDSSANKYEDRVEYVDGQRVTVEERATLEAQKRLRTVRAERIERERLAKELRELETLKDRAHEESGCEQGEIEQEVEMEEQVGQIEKEQHPPPAEGVEFEDLKDDRDREAVREWRHDRAESSLDLSQEKEEVESLQEEIERLMERESSMAGIHVSEHKKQKKLKRNSLGEASDSRSTHSKKSNSAKRSTPNSPKRSTSKSPKRSTSKSPKRSTSKSPMISPKSKSPMMSSKSKSSMISPNSKSSMISPKSKKKKKARSDDSAISEKPSSTKKLRSKLKESNLYEDDGATTLSAGTKKSKSSKSPKKKKKKKVEPSTVDVEAYPDVSNPDVSKTTDSMERVYDDDDDDNLSSVSFESPDGQQGTTYEKSIQLL
jgi:hypothetical protein